MAAINRGFAVLGQGVWKNMGKEKALLRRLQDLYEKELPSITVKSFIQTSRRSSRRTEASAAVQRTVALVYLLARRNRNGKLFPIKPLRLATVRPSVVLLLLPTIHLPPLPGITNLGLTQSRSGSGVPHLQAHQRPSFGLGRLTASMTRLRSLTPVDFHGNLLRNAFYDGKLR